MEMLNSNGNISIHPVSGGKEKTVNIWIEDKDSAIQILEIEMTMENFAKALTGHGHIPMKFHLSDASKVGMKHEVMSKRVVFNRQADGTISKEEVNSRIHEFEVDGWIGDIKDYDNHHNFIKSDNKTQTVKINFHRWIEK